MAGLAVAAGFGLGGLLLAVASGSDRSWQPPAVSADLVVARVHHESVTWSMVAEQMDAAAVMGRPVPTDTATWRAAVRTTLDSVVGDVLTRHLMESQGVHVSDEAIDAAVAAVRQSFGGEVELNRAMREMRVSMSQLRETQRRGLYLQAMIDRMVPVGDGDVDAYLARQNGAGMERGEAAARLRNEIAPSVIAGILDRLRADPAVWLIDVNRLP